MTSSHRLRPPAESPAGHRVDVFPMPPPLLALPTDLLRIILSFVAHSPLSVVPTRFVCRRLLNLLPRQSRQVVYEFCELSAAGGYLNLIKWARTNGCPWNADTCAN